MTLIKFRENYPDHGPQITFTELEAESRVYERDEAGNDRYYAPACSLVSHGIQNERWHCICGGTSLLVYAWNAPFYRRPFDYASLEASLQNYLSLLIAFRRRDLTTLNLDEEPEIEQIFEALTKALGTGRARAQVSAAKALHVIAPSFFPMWDHSIAFDLYNCPYNQEPGVAYVAFCERIRTRIASLQDDWNTLPPTHRLRQKAILKRVDEFNFMRRPR